MTRQIKFRAWDITRNELLLWDELKGYDLAGMIDDPNITIEQFTGLHDKNSKEIYEGDIVVVTYEQRPYAVEYWDKGWASYVLTYGNGKYLESSLADYEDIEVIGNIHERENV